MTNDNKPSAAPVLEVQCVPCGGECKVWQQRAAPVSVDAVMVPRDALAAFMQAAIISPSPVFSLRRFTEAKAALESAISGAGK
jgi:hypothetical protein